MSSDLTYKHEREREEAAAMTKLPDLSRTAAALKEFDEKAPALGEQLSDSSQLVSMQAFHEIERLERAVGVAYGEDTKDRNSPGDCARLIRPGPAVPGPGCELSFVRRMVKMWEQQP